ncbi:hypothetical protein BO224_05380, partial [Erysipelotrichaceae bacterium NYU-BL-E8]
MSEINTSNISENQFFHQLVELNKTINKLTIQYEKSQEENEANRKLIKSLTEQLDQANATILDLSAQIRLMAAQKYGRSSEKRKPDKKDDHDQPSGPSAKTPAPGASARKRPVRSKARKPKESLEDLIKKMNLPVTDELHELSEDQRICSVCGTELTPIGRKLVRHEVRYIPGKLEIIRHYSVSYGCPECKRKSRDPRYLPGEFDIHPVMAKAPESLLFGKWVSPSLMALVITLKALYQLLSVL